MNLAMLPLGESAWICAIEIPEQPAVCRRLEDLGFAPGTAVETLRRAPLGDPTVYRVGASEVCLRREQAQAILIESVH